LEERAVVDSEVTSLVRNAFKRAHDILKKYRRILDSLAARLVESKTIEREEFDSILSSFGLVQVLWNSCRIQGILR
jgi:cell division protease FtsH